MKDFIIIYDVLDNGGVPNEMQNWVNSLSKDNKVKVITLKKSVNEKNITSISKNIEVIPCSYFSFWQLLKKCSNPSSYICAFGYFNIFTIISVLFSKKYKRKLIFIPLGQITSVVLNYRIFSINPDIKNLKNIRVQKDYIINKVKVVLSPLGKKVFHFFFNRFIVSNSNYIGCFSEFEESQIRKHSKEINAKFIKYCWGISNIDNLLENQNFYTTTFENKSNKLNFIFWGRLDYFFKGLDCLIKGVSNLKQSNNNLSFRIFLMGPDYNHSLVKIKEDLKKFNLSEDIIITTPAQYVSENKIPLREADASILLSKWDGFPRSLRESISFGVPILVSKETHFSEFVSKYNVGIAIEDIYNDEEIGNALLKMSDKSKLVELKKNALNNRDRLLWDNQINNFVLGLE